MNHTDAVPSHDHDELTVTIDGRERTWKSYRCVEANARRIDDAQKHCLATESSTVLTIGIELLKAQERLAKYGTGTFVKWMRERLNISSSSGYRMMQVANAFGDFPILGTMMDKSALYLLSEPNTPQQAREECLSLAKAGARVARKRAMQIIDDFRAQSNQAAVDPASWDDGPDDDGSKGEKDKQKPQRVDRMKLLWERSTADERREFLKWIEDRKVTHRFGDVA